MKRCSECRKRLPIGEFYNGSAKCKECVKRRVRARRYDLLSREKVLEYDRMRSKEPRRKVYLLEARRKRRTKYPQKYKAWAAVSNALRDGKLVRQPCVVCGEPAQAHHEDYSKPLEVTWLCFRHHRFLKHAQFV